MLSIYICYIFTLTGGFTMDKYKYSAIQILVNNTADSDIRSFLTSALAVVKKLLHRFINSINQQLHTGTPEEKYAMYEWFISHMEGPLNELCEEYLLLKIKNKNGKDVMILVNGY